MRMIGGWRERKETYRGNRTAKLACGGLEGRRRRARQQAGITNNSGSVRKAVGTEVGERSRSRY